MSNLNTKKLKERPIEQIEQKDQFEELSYDDKIERKVLTHTNLCLESIDLLRSLTNIPSLAYEGELRPIYQVEDQFKTITATEIKISFEKKAKELEKNKEKQESLLNLINDFSDQIKDIKLVDNKDIKEYNMIFGKLLNTYRELMLLIESELVLNKSIFYEEQNYSLNLLKEAGYSDLIDAQDALENCKIKYEKIKKKFFKIFLRKELEKNIQELHNLIYKLELYYKTYSIRNSSMNEDQITNRLNKIYQEVFEKVYYSYHDFEVKNEKQYTEEELTDFIENEISDSGENIKDKIKEVIEILNTNPQLIEKELLLKKYINDIFPKLATFYYIPSKIKLFDSSWNNEEKEINSEVVKDFEKAKEIVQNQESFVSSIDREVWDKLIQSAFIQEVCNKEAIEKFSKMLIERAQSEEAVKNLLSCPEPDNSKYADLVKTELDTSDNSEQFVLDTDFKLSEILEQFSEYEREINYLLGKMQATNGETPLTYERHFKSIKIILEMIRQNKSDTLLYIFGHLIERGVNIFDSNDHILAYKLNDIHIVNKILELNESDKLLNKVNSLSQFVTYYDFIVLHGEKKTEEVLQKILEIKNSFQENNVNKYFNYVMYLEDMLSNEFMFFYDEESSVLSKDRMMKNILDSDINILKDNMNWLSEKACFNNKMGNVSLDDMLELSILIQQHKDKLDSLNFDKDFLLKNNLYHVDLVDLIPLLIYKDNFSDYDYNRAEEINKGISVQYAKDLYPDLIEVKNKVCHDFGLTGGNDDLLSIMKKSSIMSNLEYCQYLYFLDKHDEFRAFIKNNFAVKNLEYLAEITHTLLKDGLNTENLFENIRVVKKLAKGMLEGNDCELYLLDNKYQIDIDWFIKVAKDTGFNVLQYMKKYHNHEHTMSCMGEWFNDQETYKKALDEGIFEYDANHLYHYKIIKSILEYQKYSDLGDKVDIMKKQLKKRGDRSMKNEFALIGCLNAENICNNYETINQYLLEDGYDQEEIDKNLVEILSDFTKVEDNILKYPNLNLTKPNKERLFNLIAYPSNKFVFLNLQQFKDYFADLGEEKLEELTDVMVGKFLRNGYDSFFFDNLDVEISSAIKMKYFENILQHPKKIFQNYQMFEEYYIGLGEKYDQKYLQMKDNFKADIAFNGVTFINDNYEYFQDFYRHLDFDQPDNKHFLARIFIEKMRGGEITSYAISDGKTEKELEKIDFPVNKDNFLEYLKPNIPILEIKKDRGLLKDPVPWTKEWFLEDKSRLEYLDSNTIKTFKKFGTSIAIALLGGTQDLDSFKNFYSELIDSVDRDSERSIVLQLGEVFSLIISKENYNFFDEILDDELSVGESFKRFVEENQISEKGKTILTLMFSAELNLAQKSGTKKNMQTIVRKVYEKLQKYNKVIELYEKENIPEGLRTSIGLEYEVTKSIAEMYKKKTNSDYKQDIEILSAYGGVAKGTDAIHEIATKPTDNPYLLLLELKLLDDLDFIDMNFEDSSIVENLSYDKGSRSFHITLGGEYGIKCNDTANFIQNILVAANLGGINAGKLVSRLNNYSNIKDKGSDCEKVFAEKTPVTEYRYLSIDKNEPFGKCMMSIFNLNMAKQALEKHTKITQNVLETLFRKVKLNNVEHFKTICEDHHLLKEKIDDFRVWEIIYDFVKLQLNIMDIVDDHNDNFLKNETFPENYPASFNLLRVGLIDGGKQGRVLANRNINWDFEYMKEISINQAINTQEDFFEILANENKLIKNIEEIDAKYKKLIYLWFKKYVKEPLQKIEKEDIVFYNQLNRYVTKQGSLIDIDDKIRNTNNFRSIIQNDSKIDFDNIEEYSKTLTFDSNDFYSEVTLGFVNKLTQINNLFLKPPTTKGSFDTVNAKSVFDSTEITNLEGEKYFDSDLDAASRNVFDCLEKGVSTRKGRYNIQGSSDKMIVNNIQQAILDFDQSITSILKEVTQEETLRDVV